MSLPDAGNHEAQVQVSLMAFQSLLESYQVSGSSSSSALPTAQPPKPPVPPSTQSPQTTLEPLSSLEPAQSTPFPSLSLPPPFFLFSEPGPGCQLLQEDFTDPSDHPSPGSTLLCIPRPYFPPLQSWVWGAKGACLFIILSPILAWG